MIIPVRISGSTFTARERFPFVDGQQVSIDSRIANQVPAPLVEFDSQGQRVFYYLVNVADGTFQVSATSGGTPIALTDSGTGQITVSEYPPLTWQELVDLPLVRPSDIRARLTTPETAFNLSAAPDTSVGVTLSASAFTAPFSLKIIDWTAVQISSDGTLPSPLVSGVTYYALDTTDTTFRLASVIGGSALTLTGGSGQLSFQNVTLNNVLEAKIALAGEWLYDAELVRVTNHMKSVGRSWWWWMTPPTETTDAMFYPDGSKAQIVLDNLRNPEKLIPAWVDFVMWAMAQDGMWRNQAVDQLFLQQFGPTSESVAKKRAEQRLAQQDQLLFVSGYQGAQRIFDFGQMASSISISLI